MNVCFALDLKISIFVVKMSDSNKRTASWMAQLVNCSGRNAITMFITSAEESDGTACLSSNCLAFSFLVSQAARDVLTLPPSLRGLQ